MVTVATAMTVNLLSQTGANRGSGKISWISHQLYLNGQPLGESSFRKYFVEIDITATSVVALKPAITYSIVAQQMNHQATPIGTNLVGTIKSIG